MINYSNANFVKSASKYDEAPGNKLPEVLLCGKSNVGKSTFLNALTNHKKLAFTSKSPGQTRLLNFYNVDNAFYLVDSPGYGYAKINVLLDKAFATMMDDYFEKSSPKLCVLLLDSRREFSEDDITMINYINDKKLPLVVLFTKVDKINQKEKSALAKRIKLNNLENENYNISSTSGLNIEKVRNVIESYLKK